MNACVEPVGYTLSFRVGEENVMSRLEIKTAPYVDETGGGQDCGMPSSGVRLWAAVALILPRVGSGSKRQDGVRRVSVFCGGGL